MNAVNLIPGDARKRQVSVSASPLTLGLIGGLVVILAAAVFYVSAVNDVRARTGELTKVNANVTAWQATANSYASLVTSSQQRDQQLSAIRQLATSRFPWSQLLSQIGGLMPADAALSTLQAATPTGTTASPSTTGTAPSAAPTTQSPPSVQLTGCAQSQSTVAQTMVQLHKVQGISDVALASSSVSSSSSGASTPSAGQSGGCPFPVSFQISLTFAAPSTGASSTVAGSTTPAGTTPASAATATPATTPTGGTS
jgi:Tfp pilus assembly protein PilN